MGSGPDDGDAPVSSGPLSDVWGLLSVLLLQHFRPSEERLGCSEIKCLIQAQTHLIHSVSVPGMRPVQDGCVQPDSVRRSTLKKVKQALEEP